MRRDANNRDCSSTFLPHSVSLSSLFSILQGPRLHAFSELRGGGGRSSGGLGPLHLACLTNNSHQVATLLRNKAVDISATDKNGCTPLHCACHAGNKGIVELLIQERANRLTSALHKNDAHSKIKSYFNLTDKHENTPIGIACIAGHTEIVELLLKQDGVDINHTDSQKRTPLDMACKQGHTETVKLLLEHGAKVSVTDGNELTPLCNASIPRHKEKEIGQLLLKYGVANVNHPNKDNHTPLGMTCIERCKEIVKLLLKNGAIGKVTDEDNVRDKIFNCISERLIKFLLEERLLLLLLLSLLFIIIILLLLLLLLL
ncbi:PREDICTED: 26S proteasome non-ATPase regulatory subunit 10-like isoform X2 [Amphimedon queenslandica]|uniref:Uncharacterized protein n=1 Tax=Amphimedon queenslandica TaxID=400682 RepID=A0AAN0JGP4_AMPQE|nr:PREDICTED: 26S proteasome non-ATPase regulatory subunit 10-like isoform X2 [Amphimedon queenslandica]|eukprot:XP_019856134.1 PREDICTED: 26S proteasome non-ATPase regulatory subunit 10-like isoform X2 [Amphimedon queenslandica]